MSPLGLGIGLRLDSMGGGGGAPFSPSGLFVSNTGAWYDPSDLSSMFQLSTGATAPAVNSPVGYLGDKSGNGNHALQATVGARPILRQDGGGRYYLEFDGSDDFLRAAFTIAQPFDRVSAVQQVTWFSGERLFDGVTGIAATLYQSGVSPAIQHYNGSAALNNNQLALTTNGVVTERFNGASSRMAVNNNAYLTGDTGALVPGGVTIAANNGGSEAGAIRLYGVLMIGRALTDAETASLRTYMGAKAGLTL